MTVKARCTNDGGRVAELDEAGTLRYVDGRMRRRRAGRPGDAPDMLLLADGLEMLGSPAGMAGTVLRRTVHVADIGTVHPAEMPTCPKCGTRYELGQVAAALSRAQRRGITTVRL